MKNKMIVLSLVLCIERVQCTEFEKLGTAVAKALGTKSAFKAKVRSPSSREDSEVYYSKNTQGKPDRLAIVEHGVYEPDCTHTWVIGMDATKATVREIRVVEMSCPHAFPTNRVSFLSQYTGKGPASVKSLKSQVQTIAKATGSSDLTTDAVVRSINRALALKGTL